MRSPAYLILFCYLVGTASAASFSPGDIEWGTAVSGTLSKGGTLTNGDYMVKAVQFPSPVQGLKDINGNWVPETPVEPMVYIEVYRKDVLLTEYVLAPTSEPYIDPDYEVKVAGTGFMAKNAKEWILQFYNPSATISIQTRAKPTIEVTVTTDKSAYTSYTDDIIKATVTVKNTGQAFLKNVDVNLNIGDLKLRGGSISQLHQYYPKMEKGASQSFEVILVVPPVSDQRSYTFSADSKGYDVKEIEYKAEKTLQITVSPKPVLTRITLSKAIKDNIYLQNTAIVTISISNGGEYDAYNVLVNDSMNENFELKSTSPFQWNIPVIKPGGDWSATYSVKPLAASLDGFTLPAAIALFTLNNKQYNISSTTPKVVVNGPKVILNKTVNKATVNISEDVTVTVSVNNAGNIGTRVEVKDSLPEGVFLVSGSTSLVNMSEPNTKQGFSYIIRMNNEGKIQLPAAVANYTDVEYRGTMRSVLSSDRPNVTVIDPSKIPPPVPVTPDPAVAATGGTPVAAGTPEPSTTQITPGFGIGFAIVVLIIAAIYRRK
ncbi:MAG TPA: BatD family protein [Candidatus Methanoperedens sp.]